MKIYIIYHKLFDYDGKNLTIGGIQTYLLNLSKMLHDNKLTPVIYQLANKPWKTKYNGIEVHGIKKTSTKNRLVHSKNILNAILKNADKENNLVIWGTDNLSVKCHDINTLSIQHGIGFDYIANGPKVLKLIKKLKLENIYKYLQRKRSIQYFTKANHKVCVDYNYLNWIRTMLPRAKLNNIHVIPNYTHINDAENINHYNSDNIKILFARRFSEERGVFILIDIIDSILKEYTNVYFTIAGDGEFSNLLHQKYDQNNKITITKYEHNKSLEIHSKHHIAIIPTYGSEGTSLSLLEAMSSGCAPIASNVGGMTNIILDNYNGYLVDPTAKDFINKLSILIKNNTIRRIISINAKKSIDASFSYTQWSKKWLDTINNTIE